MTKAKLIILVGMPGSGKSTCVEYLKEHKLPWVYFGGITIDELKTRGLEVNEVNERFVREDIRVKEGKDAYAKRILTQLEEMENSGDSLIVLDGLYSWTEYRVFKEAYKEKALVIAIAAPRTLRHQRLASRPVRPLTEEQAATRDFAEIEGLEKGGPIANADYTILNTGTPEDLITELQKVLSENDIDLS